MKPLDLDELERLEAAATPGPWEADEISGRVSIDDPDDDSASYMVADCSGDEKSGADARLIAALRNAFPALLAELRARRRQVEVARDALHVLGRGNRAPGVLKIAQGSLVTISSLELAALEPAAPAKGGEGEK